MTFSDQFLTALGRWQKGWGQDPIKRSPISTAVVLEARKLPDRFRKYSGPPLYRKRHLYRSEDQRELVPLFLQGVLDEKSPTSWSKDFGFAEKFDKIFDETAPNSVAGAIFCHTPTAGEVVLNIPALWDDPDFIEAAEEYRKRGGSQAAAIFHFRGERDQNEIILMAPLRLSEIVALSRFSTFESVCEAAGALTEASKEDVQEALQNANIVPEQPRFISSEATQRVVLAVTEKIKARMSEWIAMRTPTKPKGRRGRLKDAFDLGSSVASKRATFERWRRLHGPDGLMEARWSDGTVAYHRPDGAFWIY